MSFAQEPVLGSIVQYCELWVFNKGLTMMDEDVHEILGGIPQHQILPFFNAETLTPIQGQPVIPDFYSIF